MKYFNYSNEELNELKDNAPILAKAINQIGDIKRIVYPDLFIALVYIIIGQLISTQAQKAIWKRFKNEFSPITPTHISSINVSRLKAVGLTKNKAEYINSIAKVFVEGDLNFEYLDKLEDDKVIKELTKYKGIGIWTAEMVLLFTLQRKNIISFNDAAIIRGLKMLYNKEEITKELFNEIKIKYAPYGSIASLYIWEISTGKYNLND